MTSQVSTSLAGAPRFTRPGPSALVEMVLRRLVGAFPDSAAGLEDADMVLGYCPKVKARAVKDLPAWVRDLLVEYRVPLT